jgi:hypothetical protein
MPPKVAESAPPSATDLPPLDDLEAELKLKHSRKGAGAVAGAGDSGDAADAAAAVGDAADDMGASAVARALAASGRHDVLLRVCG